LSEPLAKSSFFLLLGSLNLSVSGWFFWIVISKFTQPSEIGYATTVISLVMFVSGILTLGLGHPILRSEDESKNVAFGTILLFEIILMIAALPLILVLGTMLYPDILQDLLPLTVVIFLLSGINFLVRYALMRALLTKELLIIGLGGTAVKFGLIAVLMLNKITALEILIATLGQALVVAVFCMICIFKKGGFKIADKKLFKKLLFQGITNFPARLSWFLIITLSVVLLAAIGADAADVGIFFITLMIFVALGQMPASVAVMTIPLFKVSKQELSDQSFRIGSSLVTPLITLVLIIPSQILMVIGPEYAAAENVLIIFGFALVPCITVLNVIAKQNNLNNSGNLIILGLIQVSTFLVGFFFFYNIYGILGVALSILLAFSLSSLYAIKISSRDFRTKLFVFFTAIVFGWLSGTMFAQIIGNEFAGLVGVVISSVIVIITKNITLIEMKRIIKSLAK